MPADTTLPETGPWPANGHITIFHAVLHYLANRFYRVPVQTARNASFTLTQAMQGETIPIDAPSPIVVTVPALDVSKGSPSIELIRLSAATFTLNFTGVTALYPSGSTPAPRVQYSSVSLLWLTSTVVYVSGDLA